MTGQEINWSGSMDKFKDGLYNWDGKLARIEYLSYSILATLITCGILALINPLLDLEGPIWVVLSLALLLLAVINASYTSIVLVAKRLRSIGLDTVHLWWIGGLWLVTSIYSWGEPESTITVALLAVDILVSVWLLLTPGKE